MMDVEVNSPSRVLDLEGGINFRDLGGYQSTNGQRVAWRKLLRCGHMANLTAADRQQLAELGLAYVHDFRREPEQEQFANQLPPLTQYGDYQMTLGSMGQLTEMAAAGELTANGARRLMDNLYRQAVKNVQPSLSQFMQNVVAGDGAVLAFHCMAGKDRTGLAAAALLMALDVGEQDIIEDYLLTQTHGATDLIISYVHDMMQAKDISGISDDVIRPYCTVEESYIANFLDELKLEYKTHRDYLLRGLLLQESDLSRLQSLYLEG
ncbi:tyrosine-protein phosphatase [Maricurvus nonylphenolicus]|uniref:tyrosine-protein phosphatase n=1 Tax=Maricurvus nonylphenolicus TaxID=1008307 RepID=UPI0036F3AC51